jgi:diacylglycerol O-acyltransferase / wax synthase
MSMMQLSGVEDLFLRMESATMPMHISSLTIYNPATAPGGKVGFKDILRFFEARMYRNRVFKHRVVSSPVGMGNDFLAIDPEFDIEFHVRHIALPKPGDWRQLCIQLARLHARHLDAQRPMWECYVIEGLDNIPGLPEGCFALFLKTHYAALGGGLGTQLLAALHELSPEGRVSAPKKRHFKTELPGVSDMVVSSVGNRLMWPMRVGAYVNTYLSPLELVTRNGMSNLLTWPIRMLSGANKVRAPLTPFNAPVSPHRVFEAVKFDLAQLQQMRDAIPGATTNDVLIAVIAGAMRHYLTHRGCLPESNLLAEAPITSRSEMKVNSIRNLADSAVMEIHTHCDDPVQRLKAIVEETRSNKKSFQSFLGKRLLIDATDLLPSMFLKSLGEIIRRSRLGTYLSPQFNTTISSIRGPDLPLYMAGAQMVAYYGMDVVHDLAGLNHLICYFSGNATISVTACRKMMPDPSRYAQYLQQAHDELRNALVPKAIADRSAKSAKSSATSSATTPTKPKRVRKSAAKHTTQTLQNRPTSPQTPQALIT